MQRSIDKASPRTLWGRAEEPATAAVRPLSENRRSGTLRGRGHRFQNGRVARWGAAGCRWTLGIWVPMPLMETIILRRRVVACDCGTIGACNHATTPPLLKSALSPIAHTAAL